MTISVTMQLIDQWHAQNLAYRAIIGSELQVQDPKRD